MKVVYEDSIIKRIQRAVYDADVANRRIGYIEVTVREANELSDHVRRNLFVDPFNGEFTQMYTSADAGKTVGRFFGAEIRVEKLP
jgi:hypothetical protein